MDRAEWLDARRRGIGASDVAGILGLSPWASPYSVWSSKVLDVDDDEDAIEERLQLGQALEPTIADLFNRRTGLYVVGAQTMVPHAELSWAFATVDGFVVESPGSQADGALGVLESKTTADAPKTWEQAIPVHYACQILWQQFVTGAERTWLAVLHASFGLKFRVYGPIERDAGDIELIVDRVTRFWNDHVVAGQPPDADGHGATSDALSRIGADPGAEIDLSDHEPLFRKLYALRADAKTTADELAAVENEIKARMGECTEGLVDGQRVVSWRPQERRTVDVARLRQERPDVAEIYESINTSRVFRPVTIKEKK